MSWAKDSASLVCSALGTHLAEDGRIAGPTHYANRASLFWEPQTLSAGEGISLQGLKAAEWGPSLSSSLGCSGGTG